MGEHLWGERMLPLLPGVGMRGIVTDALLVPDQKIPDCLTLFLGEIETTIRSGIKTRFGIMGAYSFL